MRRNTPRKNRTWSNLNQDNLCNLIATESIDLAVNFSFLKARVYRRWGNQNRRQESSSSCSSSSPERNRKRKRSKKKRKGKNLKRVKKKRKHKESEVETKESVQSAKKTVVVTESISSPEESKSDLVGQSILCDGFKATILKTEGKHNGFPVPLGKLLCVAFEVTEDILVPNRVLPGPTLQASKHLQNGMLFWQDAPTTRPTQVFTFQNCITITTAFVLVYLYRIKRLRNKMKRFSRNKLKSLWAKKLLNR